MKIKWLVYSLKYHHNNDDNYNNDIAMIITIAHLSQNQVQTLVQTLTRRPHVAMPVFFHRRQVF